MRTSGWFACAALALAMAATGVARDAQAPSPSDNADLTRMFQEDQDDRKAGLHGIDWSVVKPRDDARLKRTRRALRLRRVTDRCRLAACGVDPPAQW